MIKETTISNNDNLFSGWEKPDDIDFMENNDEKSEEKEEKKDDETTDLEKDDDSSDDKKDKSDKKKKDKSEEKDEDDIDFFSEDNEDSDDEQEEDKEDKSSEDEPKKSSKIETLNLLKEKGLIDFELEEGEDLNDDNADNILEDSFESSLDSRMKETLDGLPPLTKSMVEFAIKGGNEGDFLSEINKSNSNNVQITDEMDLKDEKNQKAVIEADLKSQGYDKDYVDTHLDFLKDSGKMESMSEKVHSKIIKSQNETREGKVKEAAERKESLKKNQRAFKSKISERLKDSDELKGLKITDKHKNSLPSYMSDPTVKTKDGEVSKFQHDLFKALQDEDKSMLLARIVHDDFDLSDIANGAVTKQTKNIKKDVRRTKTKNPKTSGSSQKKAKPLASYFN